MKRVKEEKMKKFRAAMIGVFSCGVLALGLTGCTTTVGGNDNPIDVEDGLPTSISISIPAVETYADDNASGAELAVITVHLFIVNGSSFEKDTSITVVLGTTFTYVPGAAGDPGRYNMVTPLRVNSGLRKIYVGLNLTAAQVTAVKTGVQAGYTSATLRNDITSAGFAMFNVKDSVYTILPAITTPTLADNEFVIEVSRLVAKVAATKKAGLTNTASGATFDITSTDATNGLAFSLGNVNTKTFFLQKKTAGLIEDPNYPSNLIYGTEFLNDWGTYPTPFTPTAYAAVNATGTTLAAKTAKYATENTSAEPFLQGLLTYASVRARFYPNNIVTSLNVAGDSAVQATNTAYLSDLYVYTTSGGEFLYFTTAALGTTWATHPNNAGNVTFMGNYKDSYCYYLVYLTPKTAYPGATYASIRNFYYDMNINEINALGYPSPEEPCTTCALSLPTNITVDVVIQNWTVITHDTPLSPL